MISAKQKKIYDFITSYSKKHGIVPSLEEIAEHFSEFLKYPSSAHYHVKKLQAEGYLERKQNHPRSIVVYPNGEIKSPVMNKSGLDFMGIPILGTANAGPATLFADENVEGYLKVSHDELNRKNGIFALRVEGDSMNQAKIDGKYLEEGDFVLIDSENKNPRNGDYVLSILDGCANLKKFKRDSRTNDIMLISESTNPKHKPIYISSDDNFMVNGKIVSVIKK